MNLEPFLKCCVIKSEFSEYPKRPFRVAFDAFIGKSGSFVNEEEKHEVIVYMGESDVLGDNLCRISIETMHLKKALVRLVYISKGGKKRTFWVPREQIEWH